MLNRATLLRLVVVLVLAAVAVAGIVWLPDMDQPFEAFIDWLRGLGVWAPVMLAAAYVPLATLLLPTWPLTWSAGLLLGVVPGFLAAWVGSLAGAVVAFSTSRYLAGDYVESLRKRYPLLRAIETAIEQKSFQIVLLTRLSPLFPYNVLNYVFGSTRLPLSTFALASGLGLLPLTAMHVYLGAAVKKFSDVLQGHVESSRSTSAALVAGIVATLLATVIITREARRALRAAVGEDQAPGDEAARKTGSHGSSARGPAE